MDRTDQPLHVWIRTALVGISLVGWSYCLRYRHPAQLNPYGGAAIGLFVGWGLQRLYAMAFVQGGPTAAAWIREKPVRIVPMIVWGLGTIAIVMLLAPPFLKKPVPGLPGDYTGNEFMAAGFYEEALEKYLEEIEQGQEGAKPWFGLSQVYRKLGDPRKAEEAAREGLKITPGVGAGYFHLGRALLDQDRPDEAIAAAREGLQKDPKALLLRDLEAMCFAHKGDLAAAEKVYAELSSGESPRPIWLVRHAGVLLKLGRLAESRKALDAAVARARKAFKNDPSELQTVMELAEPVDRDLTAKGHATTLTDEPPEPPGPEGPPAGGGPPKREGDGSAPPEGEPDPQPR